MQPTDQIINDLNFLYKEFGQEPAWERMDGKPIVNKLRLITDFQATSPISDALSKDLKKRGFTFVGSTIVYAFMQAVGMYNDHLVTCFRHDEVKKQGAGSKGQGG